MAAVWYKIWRQIRHTTAIVLLLFALLLGLALSLTPLIAQHRLQLQQWISTTLQQPIEVKRVSARWRNLGPALEFEQVTLFDDAKTQAILTVRQLEVDVNIWRSLLHRKLMFSRVSIAGADITLKQTADGNIILAGTKPSANEAENHGFTELLAWLGSERFLQLTDMHLTWQDKDGAEAVFSPLAMTLSNQGQRHYLQGTTVYKNIPLQFNIAANGSLEDLHHLQAKIYLNGKGMASADWLTAYMPTGYQWLAGSADVEVWSTWHQQWQQGKVHITGKDLELAFKQQRFASQKLDMMITWQHNQPGYDISLNGQQLMLDFDGLFRTPLPLQNLQADLNLLPQTGGWQWRIKNLSAQADDAKLQGKAALIFTSTQPKPWLDLQAHLTAASAKQVSRFLPAAILSKGLVHWLDHAFISAHGGVADVVVHGQLADFPFVHNNGKFLVSAQLNDVNFRYWPTWPLAEHLFGKLLFSGQRMDVEIQKGQILNTPITAHVYIPVMSRTAPSLLTIDGQAKGQLAAIQQFLLSSPLHEHFTALKALSCQGDAELQLKLTWPIAQKHLPWQINGQLVTQNSQLHMVDRPWSLTNLHGTFNFTNDTLTAKSIRADILGYPAQLNIDTVKGSIQATVASQFDISGLAKTMGLVQPAWLTGVSNYQALLKFRRGQPTYQVDVDSNLQGIAIDLPSPFAKSAKQTRNFHLRATMKDQSPLYLTGQYGALLRAALTPDASFWQIALNNPQIAGQLSIPKQQGVWQARLERLYLMPGLVKSSSWHPTDIPAIKLISADTRYGSKRFGQVQLETRKLPNGIAIKSLQALSPAFTLAAEGNWQEVNQQQLSELKGSLSSSDIAGMLQNFGLPPRIEGRQAQAQFDVQWEDAIYAPKLRVLKGNVILSGQKGRIVNIGAESSKVDLGRLLSLLSLQTLTRRLQLDFSDITKHGYTFDQVQGSFSLNKGEAITQNTRLDGPVAQLDLDGRIGIVNEDYGLQIKVTPHLTSSLPVIAALAGGPVAGAVIWAADRVLGSEVNKIATYFYRVTGSWEHPDIVEVRAF